MVCAEFRGGGVGGQYGLRGRLDALDLAGLFIRYNKRNNRTLPIQSVTAASQLIAKTESALCDAARAYLDFWWSCEGHWSNSTQAMFEEQEARQYLCAAFQFLVERRLAGHLEWPAGAWFDGFFPDRIQVTGRDALEISGAFLWVDGRNDWWLEPGFASVEFDAGQYTLKIGDLSQGLSKVPYTNRRRAQTWIEPTAWMFTFQGTF